MPTSGLYKINKRYSGIKYYLLCIVKIYRLIKGYIIERNRTAELTCNLCGD